MEALAAQPKIYEQSNEQLEAHYDATTQFSELLDGNMRTSFELYFDGNELYGQDGRAMQKITQDALADAKNIVKKNPEMWFEVRRRRLENDEIKLAHQMALKEIPNTMVIVSDFPKELKDSKEDIGGYNVTRKQAMLRILTLKPDGNIQLYSQSLDGSDRSSLEAIYEYFDQSVEDDEFLGQRVHVDLSPDDQSDLVDVLTGVYDRSMTAKYGGEWFAGRRPADYRNTYDFVCEQRDLVAECVQLRLRGQLNDSRMYDLAATMQNRFKHKQGSINNGIFMSSAVSTPPQLLQMEIKLAGMEARSRGDKFSACGGTLRAENFDQSSESSMELAGYGNKKEEDKFGSLTFKCQKGHENTRPRNKLIERCKTCGISVKC